MSEISKRRKREVEEISAQPEEITPEARLHYKQSIREEFKKRLQDFKDLGFTDQVIESSLHMFMTTGNSFIDQYIDIVIEKGIALTNEVGITTLLDKINQAHRQLTKDEKKQILDEMKAQQLIVYNSSMDEKTLTTLNETMEANKEVLETVVIGLDKTAAVFQHVSTELQGQQASLATMIAAIEHVTPATSDIIQHGIRQFHDTVYAPYMSYLLQNSGRQFAEQNGQALSALNANFQVLIGTLNDRDRAMIAEIKEIATSCVKIDTSGLSSVMETFLTQFGALYQENQRLLLEDVKESRVTVHDRNQAHLAQLKAIDAEYEREEELYRQQHAQLSKERYLIFEQQLQQAEEERLADRQQKLEAEEAKHFHQLQEEAKHHAAMETEPEPSLEFPFDDLTYWYQNPDAWMLYFGFGAPSAEIGLLLAEATMNDAFGAKTLEYQKMVRESPLFINAVDTMLKTFDLNQRNLFRPSVEAQMFKMALNRMGVRSQLEADIATVAAAFREEFIDKADTLAHSYVNTQPPLEDYQALFNSINHIDPLFNDVLTQFLNGSSEQLVDLSHWGRLLQQAGPYNDVANNCHRQLTSLLYPSYQQTFKELFEDRNYGDYLFQKANEQMLQEVFDHNWNASMQAFRHDILRHTNLMDLMREETLPSVEYYEPFHLEFTSDGTFFKNLRQKVTHAEMIQQFYLKTDHVQRSQALYWRQLVSEEWEARTVPLSWTQQDPSTQQMAIRLILDAGGFKKEQITSGISGTLANLIKLRERVLQPENPLHKTTQRELNKARLQMMSLRDERLRYHDQLVLIKDQLHRLQKNAKPEDALNINWAIHLWEGFDQATKAFVEGSQSAIYDGQRLQQIIAMGNKLDYNSFFTLLLQCPQDGAHLLERYATNLQMIQSHGSDARLLLQELEASYCLARLKEVYPDASHAGWAATKRSRITSPRDVFPEDKEDFERSVNGYVVDLLNTFLKVGGNRSMHVDHFTEDQSRVFGHYPHLLYFYSAMPFTDKTWKLFHTWEVPPGPLQEAFERLQLTSQEQRDQWSAHVQRAHAKYEWPKELRDERLKTEYRAGILNHRVIDFMLEQGTLVLQIQKFEDRQQGEEEKLRDLKNLVKNQLELAQPPGDLVRLKYHFTQTVQSELSNRGFEAGFDLVTRFTLGLNKDDFLEIMRYPSYGHIQTPRLRQMASVGFRNSRNLEGFIAWAESIQLEGEHSLTPKQMVHRLRSFHEEIKASPELTALDVMDPFEVEQYRALKKQLNEVQTTFETFSLPKAIPQEVFEESTPLKTELIEEKKTAVGNDIVMVEVGRHQGSGQSLIQQFRHSDVKIAELKERTYWDRVREVAFMNIEQEAWLPFDTNELHHMPEDQKAFIEQISLVTFIGPPNEYAIELENAKFIALMQDLYYSGWDLDPSVQYKLKTKRLEMGLYVDLQQAHVYKDVQGDVPLYERAPEEHMIANAFVEAKVAELQKEQMEKQLVRSTKTRQTKETAAAMVALMEVSQYVPPARATQPVPFLPGKAPNRFITPPAVNASKAVPESEMKSMGGGNRAVYRVALDEVPPIGLPSSAAFVSRRERQAPMQSLFVQGTPALASTSPFTTAVFNALHDHPLEEEETSLPYQPRPKRQRSKRLLGLPAIEYLPHPKRVHRKKRHRARSRPIS